jgi:hypothetical protein
LHHININGLYKMERMTKTSIANLKICDKTGFDAAPGGGVMVWLERLGNRAYVCGASGPLVYETPQKARRNLQRVRSDLEPTSI